MTHVSASLEQDLDENITKQVITGRAGFDPAEWPRDEGRHAIGLATCSTTGPFHIYDLIEAHPDPTNA